MSELSTTVERAVVDAVNQRLKVDCTSDISQAVQHSLSMNGPVPNLKQISDSILNGIMAAAARLDKVSVAVTGTGWIGGGAGSVEDAMIRAISIARHEMLLTAYTITSGSSKIIDKVESLVATGITAKLLVHRFRDQEPVVQDRLQSLAGLFPGASCFTTSLTHLMVRGTCMRRPW